MVSGRVEAKLWRNPKTTYNFVWFMVVGSMLVMFCNGWGLWVPVPNTLEILDNNSRVTWLYKGIKHLCFVSPQHAFLWSMNVAWCGWVVTYVILSFLIFISPPFWSGCSFTLPKVGEEERCRNYTTLHYTTLIQGTSY